jgi:hypothetical protein
MMSGMEADLLYANINVTVPWLNADYICVDGEAVPVQPWSCYVVA